jgi:hypothetical protein
MEHIRSTRFGRIALALAALLLVAADTDTELPHDPRYLPPAEQHAWAERLAEADHAVSAARAAVSRLEASYAEARHSHHPRGEDLGELKQGLAEAKVALEEARAELPRLVEEARRAGVYPEVLRPYRD